MLLIRHVVSASRCIFERASDTKFLQLLFDWTKWTELQDDARRGVGTPALHRMLEGAKAVRELKAWAGARAPSSVVGPNLVEFLAQKLLAHEVSSKFQAVVKGQMYGALDSVHSASKLTLLSLQDTSTLRRHIEAGRFQSAASMLLQGASIAADETSNPVTAFVSLKCTVMTELEKCNFALKPDTNWPHRASIEMASRCLRMLLDSIGDESSDESAICVCVCPLVSLSSGLGARPR